MRIWEEPVRGAYPDISWLGMSGVERIRVGASRQMPAPPVHHLTGFRPVEGGQGWSSFEMPPSPWFQSFRGGPYLAGLSAIVADAPLGGSVMSVQPAGCIVTSSELSMSFLRPATVEGGTLTARARLIDAGRSVGLAEATVEDARGRLIAHTTSRLFIRCFSPVPDPPADLTPYEPPPQPTPDPYLRPLPDAHTSLADLRGMSGLELTRAQIAGDLPVPPFADLFGIRFSDAYEGSVTLKTVASEWLNSPARAIYGGVLVVLADAAMSAAVATVTPAGGSFGTLDLKAQFIRPGIADGRELTTRATVVHRGRTLAVTRAEVVNADGKPVLLATGSSMIRPDRPWGTLTVADEAQGDED